MTVSLARTAALIYLLALGDVAFAQNPAPQALLADAVSGMSQPGAFVHQGAATSVQS